MIHVLFLIQAVDKHGISALLAAIWEGHKDCVELLLQSGASKEGKTPDGKPYREAAEKPEIIAMLNWKTNSKWHTYRRIIIL